MGVLRIEATKAKAGFSKLPEKARSRDLEITRHGRVQGYFIAPDQYQRLKSLERADATELERLEHEFQAMVKHMQGAKHRKAVELIKHVDLATILEVGAKHSAGRKAHGEHEPRRRKKRA